MQQVFIIAADFNGCESPLQDENRSIAARPVEKTQRILFFVFFKVAWNYFKKKTTGEGNSERGFLNISEVVVVEWWWRTLVVVGMSWVTSFRLCRWGTSSSHRLTWGQQSRGHTRSQHRTIRLSFKEGGLSATISLRFFCLYFALVSFNYGPTASPII